MTTFRSAFQSAKTFSMVSKSFVPKSTIKTTTFPTIIKSSYSTSSTAASKNYSVSSSSGSKDQRPTVVISSDNDGVETVSDHIRV